MVSDKAANCPNCGCPVERVVVCEECGEHFKEGISNCPKCGCPVGSDATSNNNNLINLTTMEYKDKPDNNLLYAILSTVCCCTPLGIVSIIYAIQVDNLYRKHDYQGAQDAADEAYKYAKYALIFGIVFYVLLFGLYSLPAIFILPMGIMHDVMS